MTALVLLGAYLLGSVPFSFLVARLWGIGDVRRVGSGTVGATNVMRSAGWLPGMLALVLDASKGAVAVLIAQRLGVLLSQSCNLGCIYCLNGLKTYNKDKNLQMKEEVAYKSIERSLDSLTSGGKLDIVFFGGEPLLNWPLAKNIITYVEKNLAKTCKDKEIRYHLTSNLVLLPKDLIDWAKRYNISFLCDIDGPEAIHNACRPFKNGQPSHARIVRI